MNCPTATPLTIPSSQSTIRITAIVSSMDVSFIVGAPQTRGSSCHGTRRGATDAPRGAMTARDVEAVQMEMVSAAEDERGDATAHDRLS